MKCGASSRFCVPGRGAAPKRLIQASKRIGVRSVCLLMQRPNRLLHTFSAASASLPSRCSRLAFSVAVTCALILALVSSLCTRRRRCNPALTFSATSGRIMASAVRFRIFAIVSAFVFGACSDSCKNAQHPGSRSPHFHAWHMPTLNAKHMDSRAACMCFHRNGRTCHDEHMGSASMHACPY